jgi:hypothetical protein
MRIAKAPATKPPADVRKRFPMIRQEAVLEQPAIEINLLIGLDNQRWMPKHESSSRMAGDNLRLVYLSLGGMYMLMGRSRETAAKKKNFGAKRSPKKRVQSLGCQKARNGRQINWLQMASAVMTILWPGRRAQRPSGRLTATMRVHQSSSTRYWTRSLAGTCRGRMPLRESCKERSYRSKKSDSYKLPDAGYTRQ